MSGRDMFLYRIISRPPIQGIYGTIIERQMLCVLLQFVLPLISLFCCVNEVNPRLFCITCTLNVIVNT